MREGGLVRREVFGITVCALLSLAAFVGLAVMVDAERLPAFLALAIALACPVVWLALLGRVSGGGSGILWAPVWRFSRTGISVMKATAGGHTGGTSRENSAI